MKCAGCETMHQGIQGLQPFESSVSIRGIAMKCFDMLCADCTRDRKKKQEEYEAASRGE